MAIIDKQPLVTMTALLLPDDSGLILSSKLFHLL